MHVDGFRFDLASALTRGADGKARKGPRFIPAARQVSMDPLLMRKMAEEPKLKTLGDIYKGL